MHEMNLPDITLKTGCNLQLLVHENSTTLQMIYMLHYYISRLLSFSLFDDAIKLILIDLKKYMDPVA